MSSIGNIRQACCHPNISQDFKRLRAKSKSGQNPWRLIGRFKLFDLANTAARTESLRPSISSRAALTGARYSSSLRIAGAHTVSRNKRARKKTERVRTMKASAGHCRLHSSTEGLA